ncbi:hypothetical protein TNIN_70991, partial [Trichonephila inaurata madagascariensis]
MFNSSHFNESKDLLVALLPEMPGASAR